MKSRAKPKVLWGSFLWFQKCEKTIENVGVQKIILGAQIKVCESLGEISLVKGFLSDARTFFIGLLKGVIFEIH